MGQTSLYESLANAIATSDAFKRASARMRDVQTEMEKHFAREPVAENGEPISSADLAVIRRIEAAGHDYYDSEVQEVAEAALGRTLPALALEEKAWFNDAPTGAVLVALTNMRHFSKGETVVVFHADEDEDLYALDDDGDTHTIESDAEESTRWRVATEDEIEAVIKERLPKLLLTRLFTEQLDRGYAEVR